MVYIALPTFTVDSGYIRVLHLPGLVYVGCLRSVARSAPVVTFTFTRLRLLVTDYVAFPVLYTGYTFVTRWLRSLRCVVHTRFTRWLLVYAPTPRLRLHRDVRILCPVRYTVYATTCAFALVDVTLILRLLFPLVR